MKLLRCLICGETYLGTEAPGRCPFCGVTAEYFVPTEEYPSDINAVALAEAEHTDLRTAVELERGNARFYAALGIQTGNAPLTSVYKRLSAIEAEHCSVFSKLLGAPKPVDLRIPSSCTGSWCTDIAESLERERLAAAFYAGAATRATNERLRSVLSAISAVEQDHIEIDTLAARIAAC